MVAGPDKAVEAELIRQFTELRPSRQPYPPWPDAQELADRVMAGGQPELTRLLELFKQREQVIARAKSDPFNYGYEWECWGRADRLLPVLPWQPGDFMPPLTAKRLIVVLGGNRAGKTEWSVKRAVQSALRFPCTRMVFLCQKLETSRQVQQEYTWRMLPPELKQLNGKKDPRSVRYITYKKGTGFSDQKLVFPNGSEIIFLVYTQNVEDYEGIQVGCPEQPGVIGWCADESLPLDWLKLLRTRSATADAVGLWTFTPLKGITQAMQETLGQGKVLDAALEPSLAGCDTLPGLPRGYMPTEQEGVSPEIGVVYYHTRENPLGGYDRVVQALQGKPQYMRERGLCGYARQTRGRLFVTFGPHNVVEAEGLPAQGTLYMHADPHSARNWFLLWVLVDRQNRVWVVDEWPPEEDFGEWAVPTERNPSEEAGGGWDGDQGPAQEPVGWGIVQYKQEIIRREKVLGLGTPARRTLDRRAGPAPMTKESGPSTSLWQELNDEQTGLDGKMPGLDFDLAGGLSLEEDGVELLKEALWFDKAKPLDPLRNSPRLFVLSRCKQTIWALSHYTGRDGPKGACKDPIDCLRDLFTSGLEYLPPGSHGSYGGWQA